ncbi:hypothetical protein H105_00680 [Trichophyton soudanense CBS 452.61]|uniref:Protein kinase domain-containing protein n=1 Tax=Trichophyton soudanense CBS 452.61 TaxID=1215331 RepID=A0A022Y6P1_TRISD|nr:hypothetical protein H105_00680 [Trichophyton soudanense CBS 452.61]
MKTVDIAKFSQRWIVDLFDDYVATEDDGTEWKIKKKLSEGSIFYPAEYNECGKTIAEGQATYICEHIKGESTRKEAICKIRLQGSDSKLFYIQQSVQQHDYDPVPGGYMIFIVTEKVPGISLSQFWSYDLAKREKIRGAFRECLMELLKHHGYAGDTHLGNIVYDEENDRCWIVDYKHIYVFDDGEPKVFADRDYRFWGLGYTVCEKEIW